MQRHIFDIIQLFIHCITDSCCQHITGGRSYFRNDPKDTKKGTFSLKIFQMGTPNVTSIYVHSFFTIILIKLNFEKNKSLRAAYGSQTQFSLKWPLVGDTIYLYVKKLKKEEWGSNIGSGRADMKNNAPNQSCCLVVSVILRFHKTASCKLTKMLIVVV